jgi:hypothetical protein
MMSRANRAVLLATSPLLLATGATAAPPRSGRGISTPISAQDA